MKYNYDMQITMGNNACEPSILLKMEEIINTTFRRSGNFKLADSVSNKSDYTCNISFDKIKIDAPYQRYGSGLGGSVSYSEKAFGSHAELKVSIEMFRHNASEAIIDSSFTITNEVGFNASSLKLYEVPNYAMRNLIEKLTLSTQEIAKQLTNTINLRLINSSTN